MQRYAHQEHHEPGLALVKQRRDVHRQITSRYGVYSTRGASIPIIGNTAQVAAAICAGAAELGFVDREFAIPVLNSQMVARDQSVIVVGPRGRLRR